MATCRFCDQHLTTLDGGWRTADGELFCWERYAEAPDRQDEGPFSDAERARFPHTPTPLPVSTKGEIMRTTRTVVPAASALGPLLPDEMRMVAGGAGWMGTFGVVVQVMVADILSDGMPIRATFVYEAEDSAYRNVITGEVGTVEDGFILTDGIELGIEGLLAVTL